MSIAAYVLYAGQPISVSTLNGELTVLNEAGESLDTSLFPQVDEAIQQVTEQVAAELAATKAADRATLTAMVGANLALRMLPDSLYPMPSLYTLSQSGQGYKATILNSALQAMVDSLQKKEGNRYGQSTSV